MKRLDTKPMTRRVARTAAVPAMLAAILAAGVPALAQKKSPAPSKNASEAPPIPLRGLNILSPPVKEPPLSFAESDWRTPDPDDLLVIDTDKGRVIVELSTATAPLSVARVKALARQHFYDGQTFFRVIESFMDQTGDPKNTGDGGSTLPDLKGEFTFRRDRNTPFVVVSRPDGGEVGFVGALPVESQPQAIMALTADGKATAWARFCEGVAGIARAAGVDSANSQFFLMRSAYPSLEQRYTGFGRVLVGESVVQDIKVGSPPVDPDRMIRVRLASDLPPGEHLNIRVLDPARPGFKALLDRTRADRGADFSICDIQLPAQVR